MNKRIVLPMLAVPAVLGSIFSPVQAAYLEVVVREIAAPNAYKTASPFLSWSSADLLAKPDDWVQADQFLIFRTDQKYGVGSWAVQVFSDNTHQANAKGTINLPDYYDADNVLRSATATGPLTPAYTGRQMVRVDSVDKLPKGGLVSSDGRERLPLVWAVFDYYKAGPWEVQDPIETRGGACDFKTCNWFFLADKGDKKLDSSGAVVPDWVDGYWYAVPLNQDGGQYAVGSRWKPVNVSEGYTTQYLHVAANFRNATRQKYATTIFVELLVL